MARRVASFGAGPNRKLRFGAGEKQEAGFGGRKRKRNQQF
jgi:hypothetical protein